MALNNKLDKSLLFDDELGNPHNQFKSIHVAGTNGKGSCSHMMASVLQEAGYTVGLYTSPHLKDFRERIKINGQPASKEFVVDFIARHQSFLDHHQLSFFEMTVGMAFAYFAEQQVDIAVVEVGLGGRLDSTNIITPILCLITNIGLDHTQILGNTLQKIALEKAGIIKQDVPVVIGERQPETETIFKIVAAQRKAPIRFAQDLEEKTYATDLRGSYQQKNCRSAVAALRQLKGFSLTEEHMAKGLKSVVQNTGLLGRWQLLQENPKVICDTAHNKEGLSLVLEQLQKESCKKLHCVIGFVADKNIEDVLGLFPQNATYYFVAPAIPRALPEQELQQGAQKKGLRGNAFASVREGYAEAKSRAAKDDLIFVGGSTFVVAAII